MKTMFIAAMLVLSATAWSQNETPVLDSEEMLLEKEILADGESEEALIEVEKAVAPKEEAAPEQVNAKQITAEPINVDGVLPEPKRTDGELETIKQEIQKQKLEVVLNKQKAKSYKELSQSVEKLQETTVEYLEEKRAAQKEIAEYNLKVKCLQMETPGPECDKVIRRKR